MSELGNYAGFYLDEEDTESTFIILKDGEGYSPDGHEVHATVDFLKRCRKLTKEEYINLSKEGYTPQKYLDMF